MTKNKEVCDKIGEVLSKEPEVIAIFNNGSSVVGMGAPDSDVDFIVILRQDKDKNKVIRIVSRNFRIIKNEEEPKISVEKQYDILGRRADFTFISQKDMDKKVDTFYDSKSNFLESQHFLKHKVIDAVSVYDPDNLLPRLQKRVGRYDPKILKQVIKDSLNQLKEHLFYWRHHGFRNEFQFDFEKWDTIYHICLALYAKNRRLFMLPYKRLHNDLKELKPDIEKEMYSLVRGKYSKKAFKNKINILEKIISKLER